LGGERRKKSRRPLKKNAKRSVVSFPIRPDDAIKDIKAGWAADINGGGTCSVRWFTIRSMNSIWLELRVLPERGGKGLFGGFAVEANQGADKQAQAGAFGFGFLKPT
jgi:hypothetical protein